VVVGSGLAGVAAGLGEVLRLDAEKVIPPEYLGPFSDLERAVEGKADPDEWAMGRVVDILHLIRDRELPEQLYGLEFLFNPNDEVSEGYLVYRFQDVDRLMVRDLASANDLPAEEAKSVLEQIESSSRAKEFHRLEVLLHSSARRFRSSQWLINETGVSGGPMGVQGTTNVRMVKDGASLTREVGHYFDVYSGDDAFLSCVASSLDRPFTRALDYQFLVTTYAYNQNWTRSDFLGAPADRVVRGIYREGYGQEPPPGWRPRVG
jgi:hypothetical protein